jgi:malate dehydrogenase (oxaloacetate-decarboxylating)
VGIADLAVAAMMDDGLSERDAMDRFWLLNSRGLVTEDMEDVKPFQRRFARSRASLAGWAPPRGSHYSLDEVVVESKPNVLIGVSGKPGMFTENVVRGMADYCEQPIILPLSNPTSQCEAHPEDLLRWTGGRATIATGSPFKDVFFEGRPVPIAQCNNSYIFPGLGLGVLAARASRVLPSMFLAAARECAECALEMGGPDAVLPPLSAIREVSRRIAQRVAREATRCGVAPECEAGSMSSRIEQLMWEPVYPRLIPMAAARS